MEKSKTDTYKLIIFIALIACTVMLIACIRTHDKAVDYCQAYNKVAETSNVYINPLIEKCYNESLPELTLITCSKRILFGDDIDE